MTRRERDKKEARRRKLNTIMRTMARAQEQEVTEPLYLAKMILSSLEAVEERDRRVRALLRHLKADPHCTCNDCIAYHAETVR